MSDRDQGPVQDVYCLEGTRWSHRAGQEAVGGSGQWNAVFPMFIGLQLTDIIRALAAGPRLGRPRLHQDEHHRSGTLARQDLCPWSRVR